MLVKEATRKEIYERSCPETRHGGSLGKAVGGKQKSESRQTGNIRYSADQAVKQEVAEQPHRRGLAQSIRLLLRA